MATEWNFNYTGSEQSIVLKPGKYKLECWGAKGGKKGQGLGGGALGGYACGELTLKKETTLYIHVGECGFAPASRHAYNGGGVGSNAGGGGATDIRLYRNNTLWSDSQGLLSRILVAGGGGSSPDSSGNGGVGGGENGGNATSYLSYHAVGATQHDGGRGFHDYSDGFFGVGGTSTDKYTRYCSYGGGGGWFGGAGSDLVSGGAGGSGYALTKDSYKPAGYTPTSEYWLENVTLTAGTNTENANGYAKITLLQALPFLNITSYSSVRAMFKVDHTDVSLLSKIEVFIDNVLKQTINTDLSLSKTVEYTLEDNALHTLKIVVTDKNNFAAEKSVTISKGIAPLPNGSSSEEVTNKWREIATSYKSGKTSIVNTLALKNVPASLDNTLVEFSEKIKTFFDNSDATSEQLRKQITNLNNQLSQRKKWASGTYAFTQSDVIDFVAKVGKLSYLTVQTNLNFTPSVIVVRGIKLKKSASVFLDFSDITNFGDFGTTGHYYFNGRHYYDFYIRFENFSSNSFQIRLASTTGLGGDGITSVCVLGDTFTWYAFE